MNAKEYLEQYKFAAYRIRRLEEELEEEYLLIDAVRSLSDNDGLPRGNGISKPVEERAIRLADKIAELDRARLDALEIRREVFDTIQKVEGVSGDVLYLRYIKLMTWENVAASVHYSRKQTYHYHAIGLAKVDEIIKEVTTLHTNNRYNDSVKM